MNVQLRFRNSVGDFEWFALCLYTIRRPRLVPSIHRYPTLSVRWLWFTVTMNALSSIAGPNTAQGGSNGHV